MITKQSIAIFFGEFLGTFILVFFGTSIVAAAVLFEAAAGLVQVAIVWGIGVTLAIYATRHLSCAHLNPAVSLGMVLTGRMKPRLLLPYWIAQLGGATMAGACVLLIFGSSITAYESAQGPVFIGATVMALIAVTGPFTQTGLNPARDFGPRLIAWAAGWDQIAIPGPKGGYFSVYIAAPMAGAAAAAAVFRWVIAPLMAAKLTKIPSCDCRHEQSNLS